MAKTYDTSIFIFTRDLRITDNLALYEAMKNSNHVFPCFIFNPDQISGKNKFKSNNAIQFMCETLDELNIQLKEKGGKLHFFNDKPDKVLKKIISKFQKNNIIVSSVYISKDYTPFAKKREKKFEKICDSYKIDFVSVQNHMLLSEPILNGSGEYYKKFTPFYNTAKKIKIPDVINNNYTNYLKPKIELSDFKGTIHKFYVKNDNVSVNGGNTNLEKILKNIKKQGKYNLTRDYPSHETTHLSAFLKFGLISPRQVYHYVKKNLGSSNKILTQLYWRDFYMTILDKNPHVIGNAMKESYNKISWTNDMSLFNLWKNGKTGIPIVDAGMRQLNMTGWMHNRCRMIVSNFLIKILHCDWQMGEKYFAQHLVDYDPALNNGNWQWSSSTGADSQPYFRIFNPWRQCEKFDKDCVYVKKWIPELKDVPPKDILNWNTKHVDYKKIDYPKPIFDDFSDRVKKTMSMYKKSIKGN